MKKVVFCLSLILCLLVPQTAFAKKVKVQAVTPFDSNNPPHNFTVRLQDPIINDALFLYKGTIISVSHDRKYINEVVNTLYTLTPNGLIKER